MLLELSSRVGHHAQAIVKESLINPYKTIETNVLGVLNLLEYLRNEALSIPTVIVTSDKCYKNLNTSSPLEILIDFPFFSASIRLGINLVL